jgi:hypothetical protein
VPKLFKIVKDIPLPESKTQVPLNELDIGESFLFPIGLRAKVQVLASHMKKRQGKKYEVHKVDDKFARVWRTE